jgi:hypothetical protein
LQFFCGKNGKSENLIYPYYCMPIKSIGDPNNG